MISDDLASLRGHLKVSRSSSSGSTQMYTGTEGNCNLFSHDPISYKLIWFWYCHCTDQTWRHYYSQEQNISLVHVQSNVFITRVYLSPKYSQIVLHISLWGKGMERSLRIYSVITISYLTLASGLKWHYIMDRVLRKFHLMCHGEKY